MARRLHREPRKSNDDATLRAWLQLRISKRGQGETAMSSVVVSATRILTSFLTQRRDRGLNGSLPRRETGSGKGQKV